MKKYIRKFAVCILFLCCIIGFSSCSEKEYNEINSASEAKGKLPFDYMGEQHNAFLYAIGEYYQDTLDAYANLALKGELDAEMQESLAVRLINDMPDIEDKYNILGVSFETMKEYTQIAEEFLNMDTLNYYFFNGELGAATISILSSIDTSLSIDEQRNAIRLYETKIIEEATCALDTCIVITLNVYEHSLAFWHDAYNSDKNPWHNYLVATDNLNFDIVYATKSNIFQKIRDFFVDVKYKVVNAIKDMSTSKIVHLAMVDACATGTTAYYFSHNSLVMHPGAVAGFSVASGVLTSAGCGFLNRNVK